MALEPITLQNSSGGTVPSTDNSHDGDMGTWDRMTVDLGVPETMQWNFGSPKQWKKFRLRGLASDTQFGSGEMYVIPKGETDPGNYILVRSWSSLDETYEHPAAIEADGLYFKAINGGDHGGTFDVKEMEAWSETADPAPAAVSATGTAATTVRNPLG